jgi:arylsulfatase A-like enzyme
VGELAPNAGLLDVMPTLLELAGIEAELPFQGRSLVPLLRGEPAGPLADRPILAGVFDADPPRLAVVRGRWKLDFHPEAPHRDGQPGFQLFDLERDPLELDDRFQAEPERAAELVRTLIDTYATTPRYEPGASARYEISTEQLDRLRALGYVR